MTAGPAKPFSLATGFALVFAALVFLGSALPAQAEGEQDDPATVIIGIRTDLPPFVHVEGTGDDRRYAGYLFDICSRIFVAAAKSDSDYGSVRFVDVSVSERFARLRRTPDTILHADQSPHELHLPQVREALHKTARVQAEFAVDILCDPVTLRFSTNDGRDRGIFSPIVYVTGVSYILRTHPGWRGTSTLAFVQGTTARSTVEDACSNDFDGSFSNPEAEDVAGFSRACRAAGERLSEALNSCYAQSGCFGKSGEDRGERPLARDELVYVPDGVHAGAAACTDATFRQIGGTDVGGIYRICAFRSHTDLVEWFCAPSADPRLGAPKFYFGDKEIIVGQVEAYEAANGSCSDRPLEMDFPFFSYEPYALLISPSRPDLVKFVQRRIYEIFSDREEITSIFTANFKGKRMSQPLANLFLLNGVESRR